MGTVNKGFFAPQKPKLNRKHYLCLEFIIFTPYRTNIIYIINIIFVNVNLKL